jgi:von Willebrand factor type A domain
VVGFAQQVKVLGAMSSNRGAAGKAIELTTARGNTALYDALFTSVDLLKDRPGRKAVVLLSDGVDDNGVGKQLSKHSIQDVLQFAKRVNVPIYAIGIGTEIDEALLAGFAQSTGGCYGQDSNSKPGITSRTTPETKKKSVNAPDWLPVPDGAKELSYSATGAQKQLILTVDQPVNDVADFFQQRLTEQGLHIVTASNGNAQTLLVTGSGKNAEIEIASQGENQTIVRIALNGE